MLPAKPAPGLLIGGKYRLVERIGAGGMGDVFRAENTLAGRVVALKLLRGELAGDDDSVQRFFHEAHTVNRIRHANIVDVLDAGFAETGPYIAMELLEGDSAAAVLARIGRFSVEAAVGCGLGVLAALGAAHDAGVVHRDLKPQNVFLHRPGGRGPVAVKLLDFGIAKVLAAEAGQAPRTHVGLTFGTPDYLSPEQAEGSRDLDGRSDLFSLGVLLFELVTGVRPFAAPTAVATAYKIVHAEAPRLFAAGGPRDPAFQAAIDRALSKDRSDRFPTAAAFAAALASVAPDERQRGSALSALVVGRPSHRPREASSSDSHDRARPPPGRAPSAAAAPTLVRSKNPSNAPPLDPTLRSAAPAPSSRTPPARSAPFSRSVAPPHVSSHPPASPHSHPPASPLSYPPATPVSQPVLGTSELPRVRGAVLQAIDEAIEARFGSALREAIVGRLPREEADEFRHKTIAPLVLYDLQTFESYALAANESLFHRGPPRWREIGNEGVERALKSLLRPMQRGTGDLASIVRRGIGVWSRLLDFGSWAASEEAGGVVVVHVAGVTPAPVALRQWLVGVIEQSVRSAGLGRAQAEVLLGEVGRAPELKLELSER